MGKKICHSLEEAKQEWPEISVSLRTENLTNQTFERLTVLYRTFNNKDRNSCWVCKCNCGNYVKVIGKLLRRKKTRSCGCIRKESLSEIGKQNAKDYTGLIINGLTFIESTGKRSGESIIWKLQRADGVIVEASAGNVISGQFNGYGTTSSGEEKVKIALQQLNIEYETEKKFPECKDKKMLRFDFYLPKFNCCIECDGKQHFESQTNWGGEERLQIQQKHDNIKNNFCLEKGISLIRIPYKEYKDINKEYIKKLLEGACLNDSTNGVAPCLS